MIPTVSVASSAERMLKKPGKREIALLLVIAWITPLSIHLIPTSGPVAADAYVLPLFWVTLVAVYLHGTGAGLLVGLSAPLLEYLVLGFPAMADIALLALKVGFFVASSRALVRRAPGFWWAAPFAYLLAASVAMLARVLVGVGVGVEFPSSVFLQELHTALPGLAILAFLHFVLVQVRPQPDDWDAT